MKNNKTLNLSVGFEHPEHEFYFRFNNFMKDIFKDKKQYNKRELCFKIIILLLSFLLINYSTEFILKVIGWFTIVALNIIGLIELLITHRELKEMLNSET